MAKTKQMVTETLDRLSLYDFEGSVTHTVSMLRDILRKYEGDIFLSLETVYDYGPSEYQEFLIKRRREETDDEQSKRLNVEKEQDAARERLEKAQYEKLKKKYG